MASPNHQPIRRAKAIEIPPNRARLCAADEWARMSRDERAAWMRERQKVRRAKESRGGR